MFPTKVQQGLLHALWPNKIMSHILPHDYRTYSLRANQLPTLFLLRAQSVAEIRTSRVATGRIISKYMILVLFGCLRSVYPVLNSFPVAQKENKTNNFLRDDITGGHVTTAANHGPFSWQVFINLRPSNLIRLYHTIIRCAICMFFSRLKFHCLNIIDSIVDDFSSFVSSSVTLQLSHSKYQSLRLESWSLMNKLF